MVDDYDWKYCSGMHVGYTYELHWPHSSHGMCPTAGDAHPKWQYQSHFMDGAPPGFTLANPLALPWLTLANPLTPPCPPPLLPSPTPPAHPPSRQACFARPTWRLRRAR